MKWVEVQVKTTTEAVEAVSNILYEAGVGGLVIEDPNDIRMHLDNDENWDFVDPSVLDNIFEGVIVKGYFPQSEDLIDKIELIRQNVEKIPLYDLDKGLGEVTTSEINDEDWTKGWKKHYKPRQIGEKIIIKPSWESYESNDEEILIELDPGMAFGTGTHETTIMCLEHLEKFVKKNDIVIDVGCGTGILSIGAAKLGAQQVIGVDLDEVSVKVSKENVNVNNVEDIVEIRHGNLLEVVDEKADIIVSNIIAEIIVKLSEDISNFLNRGGFFISSGIIQEKVDMVKDALIKQNFEIVKIQNIGEWASIVSRTKEGRTDA